MKIAITGHSRGIGLALKNKFESLGHSCIGFSRSNGYDIGDPLDQNKICTESQNCDIFINNAYYKYAQTDLLYKLHQHWAGQEKTIVNISSAMTMKWLTNHNEIQYQNYKKSLNNAVEFLTNSNVLPHLMLIKPCAVDTDRAAHLSIKLNIDTVANLLVFCVLHPDIHISELSFIRPN